MTVLPFTSVANFALPHIAGNLSASTDEATWALTSFLVSNAIILPAAGWLNNFYGRKRFLLACLVIFTLSSLFAGAKGPVAVHRLIFCCRDHRKNGEILCDLRVLCGKI